MIIEPSRRPARIAAYVALLVCGWLVLLIALTFAGPQKTLAVIGPQAQTIAAIVEARGQILRAYGYVTLARSDQAGFVGRLYSAGALLVLDADQAGGCTGPPPKRAAAKPRS